MGGGSGGGGSIRSISFALILATLAGAGAIPSCAGCQPPCRDCGDTSLTLINEGKSDLALGTDQGYVSALKPFQEVLQNPGSLNLNQARFGYVVASLLHQMSVLAANVKTLLAIAQGLPSGAPPQGGSSLLRALQSGGGLNVFIDNLVDLYITQMTATLEPLLQEIEKDPNFSFRISSLPVSVDLSAVGLGVEKIGDLGGNYTQTEVNALEGLMRSLDGLGAIVQSLDFNLNVQAMLGGFTQGIFNVNLTNPAAALSSGLGIAAFILNSSPTVLSLRSGTGAAAVQSAATSFSDAFKALSAGLQFAENRFTGGTVQVDDVVSYQLNSSNQTEQLTLHLTGISSTTCPSIGMSAGKLVIPLGTKTGKTSVILGALQDLQKGFVTPGARISWAEDLVPLLSIGTYAFIRSTLFDKVLTAAAAGVSPSTLNLVQSFVCSSYFTPSLIQALVETVIPDAIQLDLGTAFQNPKGLRDMLPAWSCADCPADDYAGHPEHATGTILIEYECASVDLDPKTFGFTCAATAPTLVDSGHFSGFPTFAVSPNLCASNDPNCAPASFLISSDGTASLLPYVPFIDPTFGGALYINLSGFTGDVLPPASCGAGTVCAQLLDGTNDGYAFAPGDPKGLNDAIMLIGKGISGILNAGGTVATPPQP